MGKRILPPFAAVLLFGMLFSYYRFFLFFIAGAVITGGFFHCLYKNGIRAGTRMVLCVLLFATFLTGAFRMRGQLLICARTQAYFTEDDTITLTGRVAKKEKKGERTALYVEGAAADFGVQKKGEAEGEGGRSAASAPGVFGSTEGRSGADERSAASVPVGDVVCYCGEDPVSGGYLQMTGAEGVPIGSVVQITASVLTMHIARNEGAFDEKAYLQSQGIFLKAQAKELSVLQKPHFAIRERLYRLRLAMQDRYEALLYGEEAGLLSTMALGERSELAADVKTLFSDAGLSHILAISGLHISLVGTALFGCLRRLKLPLIPAAAASGAVVLLYGMMTGMGIPAMRAVGMYFIMLLGQVTGQKYDTLSALSLMAILILLLNPLAAVGMSFVFSFGAVLGVVLVGQRLSQLYFSCRKIWWERTCRRSAGKHYRKRLSHRLCAAILASFGIQLATVPIVAWYFYAVPVYVMFLNILLLPFMGVLLSFGLLGGLGLPGARLLLYVCHLLLFWYEAAADVSLQFPFAKWVIGKPHLWQICVYYAVLTGFLWLLSDWKAHLGRRHKRWLETGREGKYTKQGQANGWNAKTTGHGLLDKTTGRASNMNPRNKLNTGKQGLFGWMIALSAVSAFLFFLIGFHGRRDFAIEMLSVGQGDGIYIESGMGEHYFIDGGSTSEDELGKYTLQPFLYAKGISHIDRWFVTHMDLDHYSGLVWMLEHDYRVKSVVFAKSVEKTDAFYELLALCEQKGTAVEYMRTGDAVICRENTPPFRGLWDGIALRNAPGGGGVQNGERGSEDEALRLTCLFPDAPSGFTGTNENSLVLLLEKEWRPAYGMGSRISDRFTNGENEDGWSTGILTEKETADAKWKDAESGYDRKLYCVFTGDIGEEQERAILSSELFQKKFGARNQFAKQSEMTVHQPGMTAHQPEMTANQPVMTAHQPERIFPGGINDPSGTSDIVILKSAHHGSNNSNCSEWLSALSPELCIISAGKHNRYHHPGAEAIERMDELGMSYLCTIDCGEIRILPEKDGRFRVETLLN